MSPERPIVIKSGDSPHDTDPAMSPDLVRLLREVQKPNGNSGNHLPDFAKNGVPMIDPKDQREITRAIREQQQKAVDSEFREVFDRLNTWSDRVKLRFFDGVLRLDRKILPDPIIGIAKLRVDTLAQYRLNRNELGLYYVITFNEVHFEDKDGHKVWKYGEEYGMVETLTHEFGHLWQQEGGGKTPYKGGKDTHNREFVAKMEAIGIHVKPTIGYHLRPADGDFERFMHEYGFKRPDLPAEGQEIDIDWWKWLIKYLGGEERKGRSSLEKWQCPCGQNVRIGKKDWPGAICKKCGGEYQRVTLSQVTLYEAKKGSSADRDRASR